MPPTLVGWQIVDTGNLPAETGRIADQPAYLYDAAWGHERARLHALEALFDARSRAVIERLGIAHGWRCLEVGFGAGGLAVWLAERVGPDGQVLATDLDTRWLAGEAPPNLEARRHDLLGDGWRPDEHAAFDLVHTRAVLAHLPERQRALERLLDAVRPGGWLVVEDLDVAGPAIAAAQARYAWPPATRPIYRKGMRALVAVLGEAGRDPGYGVKLPPALRGLGLQAVGAELHAPIVSGGAPDDCLRLTVEYLREPLLRTGLVDAQDLDRFLDMTHDRECQYIPLFMVSAWGCRSNH